MSTDLARQAPQSLAAEVFGDRLQVVKDVIAKGLTDVELEVFAGVCKRTKLDPFARPPQIYPIKRMDRRLGREVLTIQASVDSFRLIAARTREYSGQEGPYWCGPDGVWRDTWLADEPPAAARVGVLRKGFPKPVYSVATWKESAVWYRDKDGKPYLGEFWQRMPAHMLAKVAETNALKRAFPNDTEGIELDAIAAELEAKRDALSQRYTEIFGSDDDPGPRPRAIVERLPAPQIVDMETGEVLEEHVSQEAPAEREPGREYLWQENKRLVEEARKRGLTGMTLNVRAERSAIAQANDVLLERIKNYDLDQQFSRE